jgi:hypothetical protein
MDDQFLLADLPKPFDATVSPADVSLPVAEVLRIAHQDAQAAYRDLQVSRFQDYIDALRRWLAR